MASNSSGNVTDSAELYSEIAETKRILEDIERKKQQKEEEEELQRRKFEAEMRIFAEKEAGMMNEKTALGREILMLISELRNDPVFLEAFRLCMKLNNDLGGYKDRIEIYERNLERPVEASPEYSWLVGHRKILDTFKLGPSLNLIFRQYVPSEHMAEGIAEFYHPYRGERQITTETDFVKLNYETVKDFYEALCSNSIRRTLASKLKAYRDITYHQVDVTR